MTPLLVAEELGRWYGQVVGLNELSLQIAGGVTGLVGPNGAGKSTFLKLITGEIRPSRGRIRVFGVDPFGSRALYSKIGFCPQQDALYDDMSALDMVRFLLSLSGFSAREGKERAQRALERVGLSQVLRRRLGTFSKGMRQRVKVAQSIAHDPEFLVLDEPMSGLDPVGRRELLDLLRELGGAGMHVLLSSHVLHEIEHLTQEIVLLHRGRLLAQGSVPDVRRLLSRHPTRIVLYAREARRLAQALLAIDGVRSLRFGPEEGRMTVETLDGVEFRRALTDVAARGGFGIEGLETVDESLEAVFDYLVG